MIYYFKAMKSLVDTKAKNSLSSYPAPPISEATVVRPSAALSNGTQKGFLILLTEVAGGNNGKDKNSNYDFFSLSLWQRCFCMTDCVINDIFEKWLLLKM